MDDRASHCRTAERRIGTHLADSSPGIFVIRAACGRSVRTRRRACTWSPAPGGRRLPTSLSGTALMGIFDASPWASAR